MPVPFRAIVSSDPGASLVIKILPLATPADAGANVALNVVLCPALIVNGVAKPLILKAVPEEPAWEIVTPLVPEFVSVIVCDALLPTSTLPKPTLAGLAVSCPCTPIPAKAIVAGDP